MTAALILIAAFVTAVVGTAAVRSIARARWLVVEPRPDRWHAKPTALYGGVAIAAGCVGAVLAVGGTGMLSANAAVAAILAASAGLWVVGLVDDYRGMGPVGKLILQLAAGTLLILAGVVYPVTPWNPVNVMATLFWFVGVVNALNLLDNMDGVSAGVAAIAAAGLATFFIVAGEPALAMLALATAGASAGFLVFNFHPASIFMGDGGSLFLGGILAGLGAAYPLVSDVNGAAAVLVPALVLLVPILDTTLVTVARMLNDRRISVGGSDHSTHRLVAMGFSERGAALFLYAAGVVSLAVAWFVNAMPAAAGLWLGILFLTAALLFTGYLGRMHRYEGGRPVERRRSGLIIRTILLKRRGLELLLDTGLFGVAYYGAFVIYYDGAIPEQMGALANATLGIVIVLKLAAFHYFNVYRAVWDRAGLADVHRVVKATLLGGLLAVTILFLVARGAGIPRMVFVIDLLLTGALTTAARSSFGSLERFRRRLRADVANAALIYGAGPEADLVLKVLPLRDGPELHPIGFVDDGEDLGTLIHGFPVLGARADLEEVLRESGASYVVLSSAPGDGADWRALRDACRRQGVEVLSLEVSVRSLGLSPPPPPKSAAGVMRRPNEGTAPDAAVHGPAGARGSASARQSLDRPELPQTR